MNIEGIKLGKQTFRIRKYDGLNIVVERLITIDPTKSPSYDPEKHNGKIRHEYREPKFHSTIESAVGSLIERAIIESEATKLEELIDEIKRHKREIKQLMSIE